MKKTSTVIDFCDCSIRSIRSSKLFILLIISLLEYWESTITEDFALFAAAEERAVDVGGTATAALCNGLKDSFCWYELQRVDNPL